MLTQEARAELEVFIERTYDASFKLVMPPQIAAHITVALHYIDELEREGGQPPSTSD